MEADLRQIIRAEFLVERFGVNISPREDSYMVMHLVVYDIMQQNCCSRTTTTRRMFNTAREKYHSCLSVDADGTKDSLVHYEPYYIEVEPMQDIRPRFFEKTLTANFSHRTYLHMESSTVDHIMLT